MTDIPEDVMKLAAKVVDDAEAECRKERYLFGFPTVHGKETLDKHIARAILADRAAQAERMARLEAALTKMQAAVSWISAPFVDENTSHEELRKRIAFCVSHTALAARALSQEGSDA